MNCSQDHPHFISSVFQSLVRCSLNATTPSVFRWISFGEFWGWHKITPWLMLNDGVVEEGRDHC
jgi:hypothetical protein